MTLSSTLAKLEKLFDLFNKVYFNSTLPKTIITVQSTPAAYGHCTTKKIWKGSKDSWYEINLGAEHLNREFSATAATLLHEMVHLYCLENDIQDTCQRGRYHNKTFKQEAEKRDLKIDYNSTIGYSITNPTEALSKVLIANGFNTAVPFARATPTKKDKAKDTKARLPSHKYICPICGQMVRSTQELNILCGFCDVKLER